MNRSNFLKHSVACMIFFAAFSAILYLSQTTNQLQSFPSHPDDFEFLGKRPGSYLLFGNRPVSMVIVSLLSRAGEAVFYYALNTFTFVYPFLVTIFCLKFFNIRNVFLISFTVAIIAYSSPSVIDNTKYLGTMTNHISAIFGMLVLLQMLYRTPSDQFSLVTVALLYAATIFAKEDFVLPPLVLGVYQALTAKRDDNRSYWKVVYLMIGLLLVWFLYNHYILKNVFMGAQVNQKSAPYFSNFSPISIASLYLRYLSCCQYSFYLFAVTMGAILILMFLGSRELLPKLVAILTIACSLIGPYSVLPNHFFTYYTFLWEPWFAATIGLAASTVYERAGAVSVLLKNCLGAVIIGLCVWGCIKSEPERGNNINHYNKRALRSRFIIDQLIKNKIQLNQHAKVGILGVDPTPFNPWFNRKGANYLSDKLELHPSWVVFLPSENSIRTFTTTKFGSDRIAFATSSELCRDPNLPIMEIHRNTPATFKQRCRDLKIK